jgi:hypothetical protein
LGIDEEELLTLWLADKIYDIARPETVGLKAMEVAGEELKMSRKKRK